MSIELLALIQGIYYFVTGIWPLLHMGSFMQITGPKTDQWLVKTVGILIAVIAVSLLYDALGNDIRFSTFLLAFGSALGLTLIEIVYVTKKVISPVYLLDAVAEVILMLLWVYYMFAAT